MEFLVGYLTVDVDFLTVWIFPEISESDLYLRLKLKTRIVQISNFRL